MAMQSDQQPVWTRMQKTMKQINRRKFLGAMGLGSAAALFAPKMSLARSRNPAKIIFEPQTAPLNGKHVLPPLPYDYSALEPHIDTMTMMLHHDRHHNTYVNNLNAALEKYPNLQAVNATDLISNLEALPEDIRTTVRNNGGGHVNHSIFWAIMTPNGGGAPISSLAAAINATFGSFNAFKQEFNTAGERRFGSGWSWLVLNGDGALSVISTPNQDSPYMMGMTPIIGNDVWEHAYYLRYQNKRADYLAAWWNTVNWQAAEARYVGAQS